jgi:hypothetical protein
LERDHLVRKQPWVNTIDLGELYGSLQLQMKSRLMTGARHISHPGTQGDSTELNWLNMLNTHLPNRYQARKAQVLDSRGRLSYQIDIVIFDNQYSPLLLHQDAATYVAAESVYAVVEVKPSLNKRYIEYTGAGAESVRQLFRTSAPVVYVEGRYKPKKPHRIQAGIITFSSDWRPPFGKPLQRTIENLAPQKRLDFGCVLDEGAFAVNYGKSITIRTSSKQNALVSFFFTLISSLQKMGTVPAINYNKYSISLK